MDGRLIVKEVVEKGGHSIFPMMFVLLFLWFSSSPPAFQVVPSTIVQLVGRLDGLLLDLPFT